MFALSMRNVTLGLFPSMECALQSLRMSGDVWILVKQGPHNANGIFNESFDFTIVEVIPSDAPHPIFRPS